ncbi:MAG: hypothetical protein K0M39_13280 [Rhizobium sp.]|jgi:hypothetical protein|uniref:hypothetical protein n=1 Tax=Thiobacillus sp. TaxID=924 RepID=UPI0025ED1A3B|nr:hypothetical protein [Thiobacillus sp.]MBW8365513.1 hypothetical protein [Rhizobium sp.]
MSNSLYTLSWLIGDRLVRSEVRDGQTWWLYFESGATLLIECLWRKIENGVLTSTSEDHGHKFGLPAPFDSIAALEVLSQFSVSTVSVREGTGIRSAVLETPETNQSRCHRKRPGFPGLFIRLGLP